MKRQDFLDYALKNNPYNKSLDNSCESHRELEKWRKENKPPLWRPEEKVGFRPYDRIKLEKSIRENYKSKIHPEKILAFISNVGKLNFERTENVSGDMLHFYLEYFPGTTTYWNDLKCLTHCIGYVENCADRVTEFYMSENGDFYTTNHEFIAKSEEEFFDYLTTVEYDFHPVIAERTYNMLRFFGWYEGRCVDTTDFECEMRRRGIELTQKQLFFFSKFSGLSFDFHDYYLSWWFYSLKEMLRTIPLNFGLATRKLHAFKEKSLH